MNWALGFFRLWVFATVIWIIGFGSLVIMDWWNAKWPVDPSMCRELVLEKDAKPDRALTRDEVAECEKAQTQGITDEWHRREKQLGLWVLPPAFLLLIGGALGWVFRGFRKTE